MKNYILYNPLSGNGNGKKSIDTIEINGESVFFDITKITDFKSFFAELLSDDKVIVCGGDGTLSRFVNSLEDIEYKNDILYLAAGSGNDFLNDLSLKPTNKPIKINDYIKNLPIVNFSGKDYRFVNGIGYGFDGYCCVERERLIKKTNRPVSYTFVALKAFLYGFKPLSATVTVDGKEYKYNKAWMAPTMFGRFFGGGMMIAPTQNRRNQDGTVSVIVAHNMGRFKIMSLFLSVFKGTHLKYKKYVALHTGHNIHVKLSKNAHMQVDGEGFLDVPEYTVNAKNSVLNNCFTERSS